MVLLQSLLSSLCISADGITQNLRLTFVFNFSLAFVFTSENKNSVLWGILFRLKFVDGFPIVLTSAADELCSWTLFMAIECCFEELAGG